MESLLLTIAETAALLRVSVDTVRRSIRAGVIPCKRLRCNIRVSRAWIDSYVAETAPMLLSRSQVAAKLGVSKYVVDSLRRRGLLPTVKIAGEGVEADDEVPSGRRLDFRQPSETRQTAIFLHWILA